MPAYTPDELVEVLYPHLGGLRFTPGYYTSTDWDGDAKNGADGIIDLSAVFGLPAGISAVAVRLAFKDETIAVTGALSQTSVLSSLGVAQQTQVANVYIYVCGIVPCDGNGDIYWGQSDELDNVVLRITGYWS